MRVVSVVVLPCLLAPGVLLAACASDESPPVDAGADVVAPSIDLYVPSVPDAPTVTLGPVAPDTTMDLTATVEAPDGASVTLAWTVDDTPVATTGSVVAASSTAKGQRWVVRVIATKDGLKSPPAQAEVTIGNAGPACPSAEVSPPGGATTTEFACVCPDRSDPDPLDEVHDTCRWSVGGIEVEGVDACVLPPEHTERGQTVGCAYVADDGEDAAEPVSGTGALVANSPPGAVAVELVPTEGDAYTSFTCVASPPVDPDGDPVDVAVTWIVDGHVNTPASAADNVSVVPAEDLLGPGGVAPRAGASLRCRAVADDGVLQGPPQDSEAVSLWLSAPEIFGDLAFAGEIQGVTSGAFEAQATGTVDVGPFEGLSVSGSVTRESPTGPASWCLTSVPTVLQSSPLVLDPVVITVCGQDGVTHSRALSGTVSAGAAGVPFTGAVIAEEPWALEVVTGPLTIGDLEVSATVWTVSGAVPAEVEATRIVGPLELALSGAVELEGGCLSTMQVAPASWAHLTLEGGVGTRCLGDAGPWEVQAQADVTGQSVVPVVGVDVTVRVTEGPLEPTLPDGEAVPAGAVPDATGYRLPNGGAVSVAGVFSAPEGFAPHDHCSGAWPDTACPWLGPDNATWSPGTGEVFDFGGAPVGADEPAIPLAWALELSSPDLALVAGPVLADAALHTVAGAPWVALVGTVEYAGLEASVDLDVAERLGAPHFALALPPGETWTPDEALPVSIDEVIGTLDASVGPLWTVRGRGPASGAVVHHLTVGAGAYEDVAGQRTVSAVATGSIHGVVSVDGTLSWDADGPVTFSGVLTGLEGEASIAGGPFAGAQANEGPTDFVATTPWGQKPVTDGGFGLVWGPDALGLRLWGFVTVEGEAVAVEGTLEADGPQWTSP